MKGNKVMSESKVSLINENVEEEFFEHLMTLKYKGVEYVILHPDAEEEEGDISVVIMSIDDDDEGETAYNIVEDESLANEVFMEFIGIDEKDE